MSQRRQAGFTLIEVLVVVGIIGILAAIAIPAYAGYKAQGVDAQMVSTLRTARTATEAFYAGNGQSYVGLTVAGLEDNGFRMTPGVDFTIVDAQVDAFVIRACATGGSSPSFLADSNAGAAYPDAGGC